MEHAPNVPVVVLSGQDDEALAIKGRSPGGAGLFDQGKHLQQASGTIQFATRWSGKHFLRALEMTQKQQLDFKNQFLSHVSHELRTPLTCIHQYVTLLLDGLAGAVAPDQAESPQDCSEECESVCTP